MICITGVPGTGKSSTGIKLRGMGYRICDGNDEASKLGCSSGGEVDIDCLATKMETKECDAIESHYAHLLRCSQIVILEASEDILRQRLNSRGYTKEKIQDNVEAQLSGQIYFEALDRLPSGRIITLSTSLMSPEKTAEEISRIIEEDRKR